MWAYRAHFRDVPWLLDVQVEDADADKSMAELWGQQGEIMLDGIMAKYVRDEYDPDTITFTF